MDSMYIVYVEQYVYTLSPIIAAYTVLMGLKVLLLVMIPHLIHIHHGTVLQRLVLCHDSCPAILISVS